MSNYDCWWCNNKRGLLKPWYVCNYHLLTMMKPPLNFLHYHDNDFVLEFESRIFHV